MNNPTPSKIKIYTRSGDHGETALLLGGRVPKDELRIEVGGQVDELSAVLGLVRTAEIEPKIAEMVFRIQNQLLDFGAEVACPAAERHGLRKIDAEKVRQMEREIDRFEAELPPLTQFIIPGADQGSALLHLARTVCRRAERRLVTLIRDEPEISPLLLSYLNRLSDLLFVLARREEILKNEEKSSRK